MGSKKKTHEEFIKELKIAKLAGAVATKVVTAAQWLWNVALNANPIVLVIGAIAVLGTAIYGVTKAFSASTSAQKVENAVKDKVIEKTAEQRAELDMLFDRLRSAKKGSDEFNQTLKELDGIQPGIVDKYNLQAGAMRDINAAQKEMIANIDAIAKAEAYKEVAKDMYKKAFEEEASGPGWWDKTVGATSFGMVSAEELNNVDVMSLKKDAKTAVQMQGNFLKSNEYKNAMKATGGKSDSESAMDTVPSTTPDATSKSKPLVSPSGYSDKKASGTGGEMKNINVRIENLVKELVIQTSNITESAGMIKDKITEAMVGAVRDFEVAM